MRLIFIKSKCKKKQNMFYKKKVFQNDNFGKIKKLYNKLVKYD